MAIPKIIHYCWFGENKKSNLIEYCIDSWLKFLPEYEIKIWDEKTFNPRERCHYLNEAVKQKKWAFVSDYVRAWALYNYGGIYLDTDVEIRNSLDEFLEHTAFSGFESQGYPFTALWGAEKNHIWPSRVLEFYDLAQTFNETTNTKIVSNLLISEFGANKDIDKVQKLKNGIVIYPSYYFCADPTIFEISMHKNYACHHFNASWLDEGIKTSSHKEFKKIIAAKSILNILSNDNLLHETIISHTIKFTNHDQIINKIGRKKIFIQILNYCAMLPIQKIIKKLRKIITKTQSTS